MENTFRNSFGHGDCDGRLLTHITSTELRIRRTSAVHTHISRTSAAHTHTYYRPPTHITWTELRICRISAVCTHTSLVKQLQLVNVSGTDWVTRIFVYVCISPRYRNHSRTHWNFRQDCACKYVPSCVHPGCTAVFALHARVWCDTCFACACYIRVLWDVDHIGNESIPSMSVADPHKGVAPLETSTSDRACSH